MACQEFCSRLQKLRWKALVVRGKTLARPHAARAVSQLLHSPTCPGEQQVAVPPDVQLSSLRQLPPQFVELPPSGMSILAEGCRAVGLHALFMTAMKIYS
jgi:hypothetical protein